MTDSETRTQIEAQLQRELDADPDFAGTYVSILPLPQRDQTPNAFGYLVSLRREVGVSVVISNLEALHNRYGARLADLVDSRIHIAFRSCMNAMRKPAVPGIDPAGWPLRDSPEAA